MSKRFKDAKVISTSILKKEKLVPALFPSDLKVINSSSRVLAFNDYLNIKGSNITIKRFHVLGIKRYGLQGEVQELDPKVCKMGYVVWKHDGKIDLVITFTSKFIYHLLNNPMKDEAQFCRWLNKTVKFNIKCGRLNVLMLEPDIMEVLSVEGLGKDISKKTAWSVIHSIKSQLTPLAKNVHKDCRILFQLTDITFSEEFGALSLNSSVSKKTRDLEKNSTPLINVQNVVYTYLLSNGNYSVGFTDRTFFERTYEHVHKDFYQISRVIGLYRLKPNVPLGENCRSFESKVHFSIATNLGMNVRLVSESKAGGFKCDLFDLKNSILCLSDFQYYQAMSPLELRQVNEAFCIRGLIVSQ